MASMHGCLRKSVILIGLVMLIFGKGVQTKVSAAEAGENILRIAVPAGVVHLDPQDTNTRWAFQVTQYVYEKLFRRVGDELRPWLVERAEVSPDGLVHTFHLRRGVRFHDGSPFNAEVVLWNLDRKISQQKPMWDFIGPYLKDVVIVDEFTLELHLTQPLHDLREVLSADSWSIYPPTVAERGDQWLKENMIGTGPFILTDYRRGEFARFTRNPEYWQPEKVHWDGVHLLIIPDDNTRAALLETGQVHFAIDVSIESYRRYMDNPQMGIKVEGHNVARQTFVHLNGFSPGFRDPRVKWALNYAVDREAILDHVFHGLAGSPAGAPWCPLATPGCRAVGSFPYDPERATRLLDEAGWILGPQGVRHKDGQRMQYRYFYMENANNRAIAEILQALWQSIGVQVEIVGLDPATWRAKVTVPPEEAEYDMLQMTIGAYSGSAEFFMRAGLHCSAWAPRYYNRSYYCNPGVDELIDRGFDAATAKERYDFYEQALRLAYDDVPAVILWDNRDYNAFRETVAGIEFDPIAHISPAMFSWQTNR